MFRLGNRACTIRTFDDRDSMSYCLRQGRVWEPRVANYIRTRSPSVFLDLGANIGVHTCNAALSGSKIVHAFECNPRTFERLKGTVDDNGWAPQMWQSSSSSSSPVVHVHHIALSDTEAVMEFVEVPDNVSASYIKETHIGWKGATVPAGMVQCGLLDTILTLSGGEYTIMKIDVEGHELNALRGSRRTLEFVHEIIIELNSVTSTQERLIETIDFIVEQGFTQVLLVFDTKTDAWVTDAGVDPESWTYEYPELTNDELKAMVGSGSTVEVVFKR
jgi:FkbM family methyltransferase